MTGLALGLVLAAAFVHATWNLLAKRTGGGGPFVWLFSALSALLYAPLAAAVVLIRRPALGPAEYVFMLGSGVLHLGYFLSLQYGYRRGDLSLIYPLARGTGPLLATLAAVGVFGERPGPLALTGAGLVVLGVFLLAVRPRHEPGPRDPASVAFGLLTGCFIATYTLWDKHAVSALLVPPLLLDWAANLVRAALLTPYAVRRWVEVRREWNAHRLEAVGVALLTPLAYVLVLTALVFTPVTYVAPARETSILIAAALGTRFLAEAGTARRLAGAAVMVFGVVALALG